MDLRGPHFFGEQSDLIIGRSGPVPVWQAKVFCSFDVAVFILIGSVLISNIIDVFI
jgi:hypothetical protein